MNEKVLLLGGSGFLGLGLQKELHNRNISFFSVDIDMIDLHDKSCIEFLEKKFLRNYQNIVILASKIGAKLFETNAKSSADYNHIIHQNIFEAIKKASIYKKSYQITYYSTSEVFSSQNCISQYINEKTPYKFDYDNPRHLYSYVKWRAENDYLEMNRNNPNIISSVKIIRPFNIYGTNQKRGVVYDMIKSALMSKKIYYSKNTTRTLTDIEIASKISTDYILKNKNAKVNVADYRNSLTMHSLALIINSVLRLQCKLIESESDKSIQYRTVSPVDVDIKRSEYIMKPHILQLKYEIERDLQK